MKVALVIAIENYHTIPPVIYATNDAIAISSALEKHGFDKINQKILIDADATKSGIESNLLRLTSAISDDDIFYFFYAGHGFSEAGANFITCWDSDTNDLKRTSIKLQSIFTQIKDAKSQKKAIFLDSCDSGLEFSTTTRNIYADLSDQELFDFFKNAEHCVCFSSCKANEESHSSNSLKHGIWTYHLVEVLEGNASNAIDLHAKRITGSSLQNYLSVQIPLSLRKAFTDPKHQTPWLYGSMSTDFEIADVSQIIQQRKATASAGLNDFSSAELCGMDTGTIKSLSGFKKGSHRMPDSVNSHAGSFVKQIGYNELCEQFEEVGHSIKSEFGLKRREFTASEVEDGSGKILTPNFEFTMTMGQDENDHTSYFILYTLENIGDPSILLTDAFSNVFSDTFTCLIFKNTSKQNIADLIDEIEDLDDESIYLDYPNDSSTCTISLQDQKGELKITSNSLRFTCEQAADTNELLGVFTSNVKLLGPKALAFTCLLPVSKNALPPKKSST